MKRTVGIIGTLDTKGEEFRFLREQVSRNGVATLVIDVGVIGRPAFIPDIPSSEVAEAGGVSLSRLVTERDAGHSMAVMTKGAGIVLKRLYDQGMIHGVVSMGGGRGTTISTSAMRALPVGFPKLMVSTLASGDTRLYVDGKDITMMYSVVDISGINRISRQILINAAAAISGMVKAPPVERIAEDKPLIVASMFGVTTPCVTKAKEILERAGYEVLVFHATGIGGRTMEALVSDRLVKGVLDVTTTEIAQEYVGGILSAGPHRLEAAGETGIAQVVVPGALDMVNFGPLGTIPEKFSGRRFYQHSPTATLMRTTKEENLQVGRIMAEKLNRAKGPSAVVIPKKGVSALDKEGQAFYDPEADQAFLTGLEGNLTKKTELIELDYHINDEEFSSAIAKLLLAEINQERK